VVTAAARLHFADPLSGFFVLLIHYYATKAI
jgi:hypothetical protein